ncbi:3-oxoacid CoA-transferase subunit B [Geodermatophilus marinus]|uniref:3-oxoacid CoA-transferase subunit B n=1 Tax=Geodermatophilus sp. LHW52908 TaxID=2303986 RepID=UPI000E3C562D|nr:3-oxoacid CoA-transferase subunit B [Geodermatophilus sp. LHW52908]RFU23425.1 3-oxoacid CoA-transferase subunit B [Geodermatophilus sp. LHW52908]
MTAARLSPVEVANRVARDIPDGSYVNLGIGLPTLVGDVVSAEKEIVFHSENGILGMGPAPAPGLEDPELINAGKQPVTLVPGGAFFHHTDSFTIMRGGHIDVTVLGAFQVSEDGDLANWATDDARMPPAVGGAMDLAVGAKRVLVLMTHTTVDGRPKILRRCTYPLTAARVVHRVYTDLAVLDVGPSGLVVRDVVAGLPRAELQRLTGAPLTFADDVATLSPAGP